MSLSGVSSTLWRERELLDLLVRALEVEHRLRSEGRATWLDRARRQVDTVLSEIERCQLARAVEVDAVAAALGLDSGMSLRQLAEVVPAPWNDVLLEHREALLALTDEILSLGRTREERLGLRTDVQHEEVLLEPE